MLSTPHRTEAQTRRWQAEMLVKRVLKFDEDLVQVISSSFDSHCETEFLQAVGVLAQAKANEITRVIRQERNAFQNRMDFIAEQAANLQVMTSISNMQQQQVAPPMGEESEEQVEDLKKTRVYLLAKETEAELCQLQAQIAQMELALEWEEKSSEIASLVQGNDFAKAQEVFAALEMDLTLGHRTSKFARELQVPNVTQLCETKVLTQWMPNAMDVGKLAGGILCQFHLPTTEEELTALPVVDTASVLHFANRNRANKAKYKAQRLVLFRQLKQLPDALGFIWLEQEVGLFSPAERRELWLELEARFSKPLPSSLAVVGEEPFHFANFEHRMAQRNRSTVQYSSPELLARYAKQWPEIQERRFAGLRALFGAPKQLLAGNGQAKGEAAFQIISHALSRVDAELKLVSDWLGLKRESKPDTRGVLSQVLVNKLAVTGEVPDIISIFQLCQDFELIEAENLAREQLESVFVTAQLAPIILVGATLPSLLETKIEPHATLVKLMSDLETAQQVLPRQVQAAIVSRTVTKLIERMETALFHTPHQRFNPLLLKQLLLDVRLIALNFPTHEQLEDLANLLLLFCQENALGVFCQQECAMSSSSLPPTAAQQQQPQPQRLSMTGEGEEEAHSFSSSQMLGDAREELKLRVMHILERFQEMDSNSRLFANKDMQRQIVDLRNVDAQRYLEALRKL